MVREMPLLVSGMDNQAGLGQVGYLFPWKNLAVFFVVLANVDEDALVEFVHRYTAHLGEL